MIRTTVESKIKRLKFIEKNEALFVTAYRNGYGHPDYQTNSGLLLVNKAREELGYKPTTYSGDIYYLLGRDYRDILKARNVEKELVNKQTIAEANEYLEKNSGRIQFVKSERPPDGLKPKKFHDEERFEAVCKAIDRYKNTGNLIPIEWHLEYNKFVERGFPDVLEMSQWKITDKSQERVDMIYNIISSSIPAPSMNMIFRKLAIKLNQIL